MHPIRAECERANRIQAGDAAGPLAQVRAEVERPAHPRESDRLLEHDRIPPVHVGGHDLANREVHVIEQVEERLQATLIPPGVAVHDRGLPADAGREPQLASQLRQVGEREIRIRVLGDGDLHAEHLVDQDDVGADALREMRRGDGKRAGVHEGAEAAALELSRLHEETVQSLELHVDAHDADRGGDATLRDPAHVELGHAAEGTFEVAAAQEVQVLIDEAGHDDLSGGVDHPGSAERLGLRREAFADRAGDSAPQGRSRYARFDLARRRRTRPIRRRFRCHRSRAGLSVPRLQEYERGP